MRYIIVALYAKATYMSSPYESKIKIKVYILL